MSEQEIYGFEFISKKDMPMTETTSLLYKHKDYGCPFIYVKTKDSHKFFACHFRTPLLDNSGISHMLEHLVLNGSKKYPIRALYSEMKKRSSATFLGAYTYPEITSYLFSTYNKQDYFNLLDVFLESCSSIIK